ncbi:MAG: hypothetical protein Q9191_006736 [Dirinaria sp. TL-2023a]
MVPFEKAFAKGLGMENFVKRLERHNDPSKNWSYDHPMTRGEFRQQQQQQKKRKTRARTPKYTADQCERGPLGPYRPNNRWHRGIPNGQPETCAWGNPLDHHHTRHRHYPPVPMCGYGRGGYYQPPPYPQPHMLMGHPGAHGHHYDPRHEEGGYEYVADHHHHDDDDADRLYYSDSSEADMYRGPSPQSFIRLPDQHYGARPLPPHRNPHRGYLDQSGIYPTHLDEYGHPNGHGYVPVGYDGYPIADFDPHGPYGMGHYGGYGGSSRSSVSF